MKCKYQCVLSRKLITNEWKVEMGVPVLVQKNYTDLCPYLATEGWPDDEILRDFLIISFPFSEKLKTPSQKLFASQL